MIKQLKNKTNQTLAGAAILAAASLFNTGAQAQMVTEDVLLQHCAGEFATRRQAANDFRNYVCQPYAMQQVEESPPSGAPCYYRGRDYNTGGFRFRCDIQGY